MNSIESYLVQCGLSEDHMDRVNTFLSKISELDLLPRMCQKMNGALQIVFLARNTHFHIDIYPNDHCEWLHTDLETKQYVGGEGNMHSILFDGILERLKGENDAD